MKPNEMSYTCPMHPEIVADAPGMCPECGMRLVPVKTSAHDEHAAHDKKGKNGYDKHAGHSTASFARKFWVSLTLTVPVVLYSELPLRLFGISLPEFPGSLLLSPLLGSLIFFYGGWVFLAGAWRELRARLPGMMTLIALAISAAYLYSIYVIVRGEGNTLFWELATLITVMLLGHWVEMRAVQGAQGALRELSKLLPDIAELLHDGGTRMIPLAELREGDLVLIRPGTKVPADSVVEEGRSTVDESMVTGESKPVPKEAGSSLIAGTVNSDGSLTAKVAKIGEHTFLAGVMRLVREAQASKSRLQILSDKAAFALTIFAVAAGGLTLAGWLAAQNDFGKAVEHLVAVLVIACPHALGLAVPLVASISTTMAARSGLLIRNRLALEAARAIDVVLFDKTGTLTQGAYGLQKIWTIDAVNEDEVLRLAASVDAHSEHFIAKAIVRAAKERRLALAPVKDFTRIQGKGARAVSAEGELMVGGNAILDYAANSIPETSRAEIRTQSGRGWTIVYVLKEKRAVGAIGLGDVIREESREAVLALKKLGLRVAMITGDSEDVAEWVAGELKIDEYFAGVLPQQKSEKVKLLQAQGRKVAMVGDGVNDAPALTQADVGIAIGAGTNVAIESAGIILVRNDPRDIPRIIRLSRLTYRKMIQNLFWATGYNVVALPAAAGAFISFGISLQPAVAALFMSLSTVIVAINALTLRRAKL